MKRNIIHALIALLVAWVAAAFFFSGTWTTIIAKWLESDTFTHGFLILPISLWLVWQRRARLAAFSARPYWPALALLVGTGFVWLIGELAGVNGVRQLAVVAMLPALALLILGRKLSWELAIPLAFLFFMVPAGDFLEAPMMEWTADFTIGALRASGIPVYREGLFFTIPSGRWSVVEACSGLRYLIASVVLGTIYAYLTYRSLRKRLAFIAVAFIVPIFANWVRAYMIVMIGHLSSMQLAVGADHLIYGWVFFGLVIGVMFAIGARWRDADPFGPPPSSEERAAPGLSATTPRSVHFAAATLAGVIVLVGWLPISARILDATTVRTVEPAVRAALALDGKASWLAHYTGARQNIGGLMRGTDHALDVQVAYFARQHEPGAEMIAYANRLLPAGEKFWRVARSGSAQVGNDSIRETELSSYLGRRLVWSWYVIDGQGVTSDVVGKLRTLAALLRGHGDHSAFVAISVALENDPEALATARVRLAAQAPRVASAVTAALARR